MCIVCHDDDSVAICGMNGTTYESAADGIRPGTYLASDSFGLIGDSHYMGELAAKTAIQAVSAA